MNRLNQTNEDANINHGEPSFMFEHLVNTTDADRIFNTSVNALCGLSPTVMGDAISKTKDKFGYQAFQQRKKNKKFQVNYAVDKDFLEEVEKSLFVTLEYTPNTPHDHGAARLISDLLTKLEVSRINPAANRTNDFDFISVGGNTFGDLMKFESDNFHICAPNITERDNIRHEMSQLNYEEFSTNDPKLRARVNAFVTRKDSVCKSFSELCPAKSRVLIAQDSLYDVSLYNISLMMKSHDAKIIRAVMMFDPYIFDVKVLGRTIPGTLARWERFRKGTKHYIRWFFLEGRDWEYEHELNIYLEKFSVTYYTRDDMDFGISIQMTFQKFGYAVLRFQRVPKTCTQSDMTFVTRYFPPKGEIIRTVYDFNSYEHGDSNYNKCTARDVVFKEQDYESVRMFFIRQHPGFTHQDLLSAAASLFSTRFYVGQPIMPRKPETNYLLDIVQAVFLDVHVRKHEEYNVILRAKNSFLKKQNDADKGILMTTIDALVAGVTKLFTGHGNKVTTEQEKSVSLIKKYLNWLASDADFDHKYNKDVPIIEFSEKVEKRLNRKNTSWLRRMFKGQSPIYPLPIFVGCDFKDSAEDIPESGEDKFEGTDSGESTVCEEKLSVKTNTFEKDCFIKSLIDCGITSVNVATFKEFLRSRAVNDDQVEVFTKESVNVSDIPQFCVTMGISICLHLQNSCQKFGKSNNIYHIKLFDGHYQALVPNSLVESVCSGRSEQSRVTDTFYKYLIPPYAKDAATAKVLTDNCVRVFFKGNKSVSFPAIKYAQAIKKIKVQLTITNNNGPVVYKENLRQFILPIKFGSVSTNLKHYGNAVVCHDHVDEFIVDRMKFSEHDTVVVDVDPGKSTIDEYLQMMKKILDWAVPLARGKVLILAVYNFNLKAVDEFFGPLVVTAGDAECHFSYDNDPYKLTCLVKLTNPTKFVEGKYAMLSCFPTMYHNITKFMLECANCIKRPRGRIMTETTQGVVNRIEDTDFFSAKLLTLPEIDSELINTIYRLSDVEPIPFELHDYHKRMQVSTNIMVVPKIDDNISVLRPIVEELTHLYFEGHGIPNFDRNLKSNGVLFDHGVRGIDNAGLKIRHLMEYVDEVRPGHKTLDIGASPGSFSRFMRAFGLNVTSITKPGVPEFPIEDEMIGVSIEDFETNESYNFIVSDARGAPLFGQEAEAHYSLLRTVMEFTLGHLAARGTLMVKFLIDDHDPTIDLLATTAKCFEFSEIVKPNHSTAGNSEAYFIGHNFDLRKRDIVASRLGHSLSDQDQSRVDVVRAFLYYLGLKYRIFKETILGNLIRLKPCTVDTVSPAESESSDEDHGPSEAHEVDECEEVRPSSPVFFDNNNFLVDGGIEKECDFGEKTKKIYDVKNFCAKYTDIKYSKETPSETLARVLTYNRSLCYHDNFGKCYLHMVSNKECIHAGVAGEGIVVFEDDKKKKSGTPLVLNAVYNIKLLPGSRRQPVMGNNIVLPFERCKIQKSLAIVADYLEKLGVVKTNFHLEDNPFEAPCNFMPNDTDYVELFKFCSNYGKLTHPAGAAKLDVAAAIHNLSSLNNVVAPVMRYEYDKTTDMETMAANAVREAAAFQLYEQEKIINRGGEVLVTYKSSRRNQLPDLYEDWAIIDDKGRYVTKMWDRTKLDHGYCIGYDNETKRYEKFEMKNNVPVNPKGQQLFAVSRETNIMHAEQHAKVLMSIEDFTLPEFDFFNGVAGAGKTSKLLEHAKPGDLIITATNENAKSIAEVFKNTRTFGSYLLKPFQIEGDLLIDEGTLLPAGVSIGMALLSKCKKLYVSLDMVQIKISTRDNAYQFYFQEIEKYTTNIEFCMLSHRMTLTAAFLVNDFYQQKLLEYKKKPEPVITTNITMNDMSIVPIVGASDFVKTLDFGRVIKPDVIVTANQSEKGEIMKITQIPVFTCNEYMGQQCKNIAIVRVANSVSEIPLHSMPGHLNVFVTRHTDTLTYYTNNTRDGFANFIRRGIEASPAQLMKHAAVGKGISNLGQSFEPLLDEVHIRRVNCKELVCFCSTPKVKCMKCSSPKAVVEVDLSKKGGGIDLDKLNDLNLPDGSSLVVKKSKIERCDDYKAAVELLRAKCSERNAELFLVSKEFDLKKHRVTKLLEENANSSDLTALFTVTKGVRLPSLEMPRNNVARPDFISVLQDMNTQLSNLAQFWPRDEMETYMVQDFPPEVSDITGSLQIGHVYTKKNFAHLRPVLVTGIPPSIPSTQISTLFALSKRNGNVMNSRKNFPSEFSAQVLYDNFMDKIVEKDKLDFLVSEAGPLVPNVTDCLKWLDNQDRDVLSVIIGSNITNAYTDKSTIYNLQTKLNAKPDCTPDGGVKISPPQTIAACQKIINLLYSSVLNKIKDLVSASFQPFIVMYTDKDADDLAESIKLRCRVEGDKLELDASKFDKSQGMEVLLFECKLLRYFGVPEDMVQLWFIIHLYTILLDIKNGVKAQIFTQRKSGDPSTFLFNTFFLMAAIASIIPNFTSSPLALFAGDDSLIMGLSCNQKLLGCFSDIFNLEMKSMVNNHYYFCSKFIIQIGDEVLVLPDPVRIAMKLGRTDIRNWDHLEEYRVSLVDLIKNYDIIGVREKLEHDVPDRYERLQGFSIQLLLESLIHCIRDPVEFSKLYYTNPGDVLCGDPSRPSFD